MLPTACAHFTLKYQPIGIGSPKNPKNVLLAMTRATLTRMMTAVSDEWVQRLRPRTTTSDVFNGVLHTATLLRKLQLVS